MKKKLWGGRFNKKTDPLVEEFTRSIQYDCRLARYDLIGSKLHAYILEASGFINKNERDSLQKGLLSIYAKIENGSLKIGHCEEEDIHTFIQNELQKEIGDLALKLHTARSRNDQVVFSTKMHCKDVMRNLKNEISNLILSIDELVAENNAVIIPGFTHMQHAQPVYLKDYLGAYIAMLKRDANRLNYIDENMKITMGAGALAGTPISSLEYKMNAEKLFSEMGDPINRFQLQPADNSLDSVSDRDFVIEIISALSIVAMHLSRLAEDLIIWSTKEFDFVEIDEAFCTGSSLMPQKKNADVLELVRGYAGRLYGNLVSVLTMMKGLPLTYNRDMQLDKEPLFNSFEIVSSELRVLTGLMKTLKFNREKIEEQLKDESLYATDLVYYLVIKKKEPFTIAHTIIGKLVRYSLDNNILIKNMMQEQLDKFSKKLKKNEIVKLFDPKISVESKKSIKRD